MSISLLQSLRHDGIPTTTDPPVADLAMVNPIGAIKSSRACAVISMPSTRLMVFSRTSVVLTCLGNASVRASVAPECTTRFGHVMRNSSAKRAKANSAPNGSTPRSKRSEASVRKASRVEVARTASGSKYAISTAIDVVASVTSESRPPMIPAIPTGLSCALQISRSPAESVRSAASKVVNCSPSRARRTMKPSFTESKS